MTKTAHPKIKFRKLNPKASLPEKASEQAAGRDLRACIEASIIINPGERVLVPTGLSVETPAGIASLLFPRSGLAIKNGITLANCVGVVDADYRGEIKCGVINQSDTPFTINPGDRIAQLVLVPVLDYEPIEADSLSETERGDGGFGHSGIK